MQTLPRYSPKEFRVPPVFLHLPAGECLDASATAAPANHCSLLKSRSLRSSLRQKSRHRRIPAKRLARSSCSMGIAARLRTRRRKARFVTITPRAGVLAHREDGRAISKASSREASLLHERDHVIRTARAVRQCKLPGIQATPGEQRSGTARKRHPILTRRIPVRTRTSDRPKEEERRRGEEETWHSCSLMALFATLPGFRCECLREEIEQVHFRDFIAYAWPVISFGFRMSRQHAKSRAMVDGSQERYTISLAPSSASFSALSAPNPALGGSRSTKSGFSSVSFRNSSAVRCAIRSLRLQSPHWRRDPAPQDCIHAHNLLKRFCQRKCEEPDSRIQISASAPCAFAVTVFSKSSIRKRFT